jgi:hypothetical protein
VSDDVPSLDGLAARFDREYPDTAPEWAAERAVRAVPQAARTQLLIAAVADAIRERRRSQARNTERRAANREYQHEHYLRRKADVAKAALYRDDPDEYRRRYPSIAQAMADFRDQVRLELTQELLGSTFQLGDGRRTTWGAATVEDHQQRIALLLRGVEGSLATAALHEQAIEMLRESGAHCLSEARIAA